MALKIKEVSDEFGTIKIAVIGNPGTGKTRFASTFPNPLYVDADGRLMSVRDRKPNYISIESSQDVEDLLSVLQQPQKVRDEMLAKAKGDDQLTVNTVVIDTLDGIGRMLQEERKASEGIDAFRPADWGWYADELRKIVRAFRNLDLNVVINVHKRQDKDEVTGRITWGPQIQGSFGNELAGCVDIAVVAQQELVVDNQGNRSTRRFLQTHPDSGHDWVKDHSGALPAQFELNFEDDYQRMAKHIYPKFRDITQPDQALEAATEVQEIREELNRAPQTDPATAPEPEPQASTAPTSAAEAVAPEVPEAEPTPEPEPAPGVEQESLDDVGEDEVPGSVPEPESQPEPEPTPEPAPAEAPKSESPTESAPVPEAGTDAVDAPFGICTECGDPVDDADYRDLSTMRYGRLLDQKCYKAQK